MNTFTIKLRSLARSSGLIRVYHALRPQRPYEDRFHAGLESAIHPGDTVWDIGANVGLYTELFAQWVGPTGRVVAFEPLPASMQQIQARVTAYPHILFEQAALSDADTQGHFALTDDSTTHHIASDATAAETIPVTIHCGDTVAARLGIPNVIKIDVEGFEQEVLQGLDETLASPNLREVLVEVHFRVLEERGRPNAPIQIERLLAAKNFRTTWLDPSHLRATRLL